MTYAFQTTQKTVDEALAAVDDEIARIIERSPQHSRDLSIVRATVRPMLVELERHPDLEKCDVRVLCAGFVSPHDEGPLRSISAQISVSLNDRPAVEPLLMEQQPESATSNTSETVPEPFRNSSTDTAAE